MRALFLALLVAVTMAVGQSTEARADGPGDIDVGGGCSVFINPNCTVHVHEPGGTGSASSPPVVEPVSSPTECTNTNPWIGGCDPCPPGVTYGAQPPAVSWACSQYLHNRYCDSTLFDVLDALDKTQAELTPAETVTVNSYMTSHGCAPITTPASLAQSAYASIHFPKPSGHRSPSESELFHGVPFTYVNLWTFFWTDPSTWHPLTATASIAGMSATVTATPIALVFDPGDGNPAITCAGPGRAWTEADGNAAPTDGACGYQYRHVSSGSLTTTQSILWRITWSGTGNAGGQIASLSTSATGDIRVMQIETVVTR